MTVRAALLDDGGVYLRMDELADPAELTARHLPQITECDLPPGRYRWVPTANEYGGEFIDVAWLQRIEDDARAAREAAEAQQRLAARRAARKARREAEEMAARQRAIDGGQG